MREDRPREASDRSGARTSEERKRDDAQEIKRQASTTQHAADTLPISHTSPRRHRQHRNTHGKHLILATRDVTSSIYGP